MTSFKTRINNFSHVKKFMILFCSKIMTKLYIFSDQSYSFLLRRLALLFYSLSLSLLLSFFSVKEKWRINVKFMSYLSEIIFYIFISHAVHHVAVKSYYCGYHQDHCSLITSHFNLVKSSKSVTWLYKLSKTNKYF